MDFEEKVSEVVDPIKSLQIGLRVGICKQWNISQVLYKTSNLQTS
jgi:hypothetical protein